MPKHDPNLTPCTRPTPFALAAFMTMLVMLIALPSPASQLESEADDRTAEVDVPWKNHPKLALPSVSNQWPDGMGDLWIAALKRHEEELNVQASDAIARAHAQGMPGLERAIPTLQKLLLDANKTQDVRNAAARALVALDAETSLNALTQANQQANATMIITTDPMLASKAVAAMVPVWMKRLTDSSVANVLRISAGDALPANLNPAQIKTLLQLVENQATPWPVRFAVAKALGRQSNRDDIVETCQALSSRKPASLWQLTQAGMLKASVESERPLLIALIMNAKTEAQPAAWLGLKKLNTVPDWIVSPKLAQRVIQNTDAAAREQLLVALNRRADSEAMVLLGLLLDDVDPAIRTTARDMMLQHVTAEPKLMAAAVDAATLQLQGDSWRGREQAALLLGSLQHQPSQPRMIKLLDAPRFEVRIAAIVGLRRLTFARLPKDTDPRDNQPATSDDDPAMLALFNRTKQLKANIAIAKGDTQTLVSDSKELAQIVQTFGLVRFSPKPVVALLDEMIPKGSGYLSDARAGAVWALGRINQGTGDANYVKFFEARLSDVNPLNPESDEVREASAIAIGWIRPKREPRSIGQFSAESEGPDEIVLACRWAIEQITGEPQPKLKDHIRIPRDWFLIPTRK